MKKILITGEQGFVGKETSKYLLEMGFNVRGYDIMSFGNDIRCIEQFEKCVSIFQPDRILHLAAIARFSEADLDPLLTYDTNVEGTKNVAIISAKYRIPLVYASTGSVYMPIVEEPPITEDFKVSGNSVYACSKYLGELMVKKYASLWIILRYSHLYGKDKRYHGLIGGFLDRINRALNPVLYGGKQSNDFMYIKDVARANAAALNAKSDSWRQVYNIGTEEELTAEEAGKMIIQANNKANPKNKFKGKVEKKMARTVDPERFVFDISKARNMLNFKAQFTFKKGLTEMFK